MKGLFTRHRRIYVYDIMTGYRAFSRIFVKSYPVLSKGFEIETEMTIHSLDKNFYLVELPIQYRDRPDGSESKLNTFADGFKVILTIFNLFRDYKPLAFFSLFTFISWIVGGVLFLPAFIDYMQSGIVLKFPSVIVAVAFFIMGLLMLVCGLILDVIVNQHRKDFEIYLNMLF